MRYSYPLVGSLAVALASQASNLQVSLALEIGQLFGFHENSMLFASDEGSFSEFANEPSSDDSTSSDSSNTLIAQSSRSKDNGGGEKHGGDKKCCMCACYDNDDYTGGSRRYEAESGHINGEEYCQCFCSCGSKATMPIIPTIPPQSPPSVMPSLFPTVFPIASPTASPTSSPTSSPTTVPTTSPTESPATLPTASPTGSCLTLSSEKELNTVINEAFANGDTDLITLCPGIIRFTQQIDVPENKTLNLECAESRTCVFNGGTSSRFFQILRGGTLNLRGIAMEDGSASEGGAINNSRGFLGLFDCLLKNNIASLNGGAIYSSGTIDSNNSSFVGNTSLGAGGAGGAIYMLDATTAISGGLFKNNMAPENNGSNIRVFIVGLTCDTLNPPVFCGTSTGITPEVASCDTTGAIGPCA